MRYVCLVYFHEPDLANMNAEAKQSLDDDSMGYDRELKAAGHLVVAHALKPAASAMIVQVRDGEVSATDGPFAETREVLGGFILIEAADMDEAVRLAAGIPLAKTGRIEVRQIQTFGK